MAHERGSRVRSRVVVTLLRVFVVIPVVSFALASCGTIDLGWSPTPEHRRETVQVAEIVDGDTIIVRFSSGVTERVRLLGIDTPETSDPTRPVQCFGAEATSRLTELISPGAEVRLERDVEARDQYGRLLVYVFRSSDELFVNHALVEEGFADISFYEPNTAYREVLTHAVTQARTTETGLWLSCGGPDVAIDPDQ